MSRLTEEFPSFPTASLPSIPSAWEDTSWHNDACPSWCSPTRLTQVYVDFPEASEREFPESCRFTVTDDMGEVLYHGDVWEEVLTHVK